MTYTLLVVASLFGLGRSNAIHSIAGIATEKECIKAGEDFVSGKMRQEYRWFTCVPVGKDHPE